jgi:hypothetical protein
MANMSDYLKQLEAHEDLEAEVIKKTKVHKVLKAIIKLNSIPKEEEHKFKQRSNELLNKWSGALAADPEPADGATNGVKHDEEEKPEPTKEESPVEKENNVAKDPTPTDPIAAPPAADPKIADLKIADQDGDAVMADADKDVSKDAPMVKADTGSSAEGAAEMAADTKTATAATDAATS